MIQVLGLANNYKVITFNMFSKSEEMVGQIGERIEIFTREIHWDLLFKERSNRYSRTEAFGSGNMVT